MFRPQPRKPGYIDECAQCAAERLHLIPTEKSIVEPRCKYCGKPVNKVGEAHGACFGRPAVRYVRPETVRSMEELIKLLEQYSTTPH